MKHTVPTTREGCRKELIDLLRKNSHRHDLHNVFSDFVEMSAISYSNAVDINHREQREARYMQIVGKYEQTEVVRFCQALAALTMTMEYAGYDDVLGATFMELELGNKWAGQFFTPYHLCRLLAQMNVDDNMREIIKRDGYVSANDPAVGGGAMPIALAECMADAGINPQQYLHVTAQDVDIKAVHMTYLQLSMLHIPAVIIHGNTLSNEQRSLWFTPAHILHGWTFKLKNSPSTSEEVLEIQPSSPIHLSHQASLFEEAA